MKTLALTLVGACLGAVLLGHPPMTQAAEEAYWYDGAVRRPLWIDRGSGTISPTAPASATDTKSSRDDSERAAKVPPASTDAQTVRPGEALEPVKTRRSSAVSAPRSLDEALPGGVLVSLKEPMKDAEARAFLTGQGATPIRELGQGTGIWLVASPPGEPALQLANRLFESGRFALAQPNWRSGMQTR